MRYRIGLILTLLLIPAAALGQGLVPAPSVPSDAPRCGEGIALLTPDSLPAGAALHGEMRSSPAPIPIPNACDAPTRVAAVVEIRNMGDPLYVIDDVRGAATSFNRLSSEAIESISILRNEEATERFGAAARNGVVIVRTRSETAVTEKAPEP